MSGEFDEKVSTGVFHRRRAARESKLDDPLQPSVFVENNSGWILYYLGDRLYPFISWKMTGSLEIISGN